MFVCALCVIMISLKSTQREDEVTAARGLAAAAAAKLGKCVESLSLKRKPEHLRRAALKFRLHQILFLFNGVPDCINLNHLR